MERLIGVVGGFTIKYTTVSIAEPYVPRLASFPERARPPRASLDPAQNFVLRQEADVESVPARQVAPSHPHREDDVGQRPRHGIAWQFVAKQNFGIRAVAPWEESASGRQKFGIPNRPESGVNAHFWCQLVTPGLAGSSPVHPPVPQWE